MPAHWERMMDFSKSFHGALLQQLFLSNTREPINQILNLYGLRLALSRQWGRSKIEGSTAQLITLPIQYLRINFVAVASCEAASGNLYVNSVNASPTALSQITVHNTNISGAVTYWLAVGC